MKLNTNMFLTAALVATLSAMVACAPAKRGTKFEDRTGPNSGATAAEKAFGRKAINTPENQEFRDTIISIDAQVEEATDEDESKEKLDELEAAYIAQGMSGLKPVKAQENTNDDDAPGIAPRDRAASNERSKYVMSIHVNIAKIGILDFVGVAEAFGNAKALQTLTLVPKKCEEKYKDLKVRAVCGNKACTELLVQVVKRGEAGKHLVVDELLTKKASPIAKPNDDEQLIVTVFNPLDRSEELQEKVEIVNAMASCMVTEPAALTEDEAKLKADEEAKAEADKKKASDEESAVDTLAGLPE